MSHKRKQYGAEVKARGALAARFEVHPTLINAGRRELEERAGELFGRREKDQPHAEAQVAELYRQMGQLKVERDF